VLGQNQKFQTCQNPTLNHSEPNPTFKPPPSKRPNFEHSFAKQKIWKTELRIIPNLTDFLLRTFGLGSAQHYNQQPKNLKPRPEPDFWQPDPSLSQTQNFTQKMLPLIFRHPFRRIQIIPRIMTRRDVIIFLWQF